MAVIPNNYPLVDGNVLDVAQWNRKIFSLVNNEGILSEPNGGLDATNLAANFRVRAEHIWPGEQARAASEWAVGSLDLRSGAGGSGGSSSALINVPGGGGSSGSSLRGGVGGSGGNGGSGGSGGYNNNDFKGWFDGGGGNFPGGGGGGGGNFGGSGANGRVIIWW